MPLNALGNRMDPPPSVPIDTGPSPAATATPEPPLDPPATRAVSHGFTASSATRLIARPYSPNSGVFVFPTMIAPAARARFAHRSVDFGDVVLVEPRTERRANALRRDEVLDRQWDAVQGTDVFAAHDRVLGGARGVDRLVGGDRDHGVQCGFELFDPVERVLHQLHRGDLARDEHLSETPGRCPVQRFTHSGRGPYRRPGSNRKTLKP